MIPTITNWAGLSFKLLAKFYWQVLVLLDFLRRLILFRPRRSSLIVDHPLHRSKRVAQWLFNIKNESASSCCPLTALNLIPDELLNPS